MAQKAVNLGGPVKVLSEGVFPTEFAGIYQRPAESRKIFAERGWKTIAALQLRNPMHRSHEYLAKIAVEICDGLMVHSLLGKLKPGDIDWEHIFGEHGTRWFHTGGIFAALSASAPDVVIEALKCAQKHGTICSYDLNYRPSLWEEFGGEARCQEVNREIAKSIDVMIGNEEDFTACLGLHVEGTDEHLKELPLEGYKKMIGEATSQFPNFQAIATTLRGVKSASINDWGAICWHQGELHEAMHRQDLAIFDRVGGGDSFASGLIYGFMTTGDAATAVDYGAAHGALAMTTPGDTTMATMKEVEALMKGASARVKR